MGLEPGPRGWTPSLWGSVSLVLSNGVRESEQPAKGPQELPGPPGAVGGAGAKSSPGISRGNHGCPHLDLGLLASRPVGESHLLSLPRSVLGSGSPRARAPGHAPRAGLGLRVRAGLSAPVGRSTDRVLCRRRCRDVSVSFPWAPCSLGCWIYFD